MLFTTRGPLRDPNFSWSESRNSDVFANPSKGTISGCCKSQSDSLEENFPNLANIKPSQRKWVFLSRNFENKASQFFFFQFVF